MLCLAKYKDPLYKEQYMLVEKFTTRDGESFTINKKLYSSYVDIWGEKNPWRILYKKF